MASYRGTSRHIDKLVKSFLSGSSNPNLLYDKFADLQDPTYLSFKLDFFPDGGYSTPDDAYSAGGLFRKPSGLYGVNSGYAFFDSASDYLARIGAPVRQQYLEIFIDLLYNLQKYAPWYFQSVSGASDLYTIDPSINFRGKDKILTIDCLESIDMRVSLLADLYRNLAFDLQGMREVLPINLRTFNMKLHVLEFRNFNTTFGIIADHYGNRSTNGQANQTSQDSSFRKNVFNTANTSLFTGGQNIVNNAINNLTGGLFSNQGSQAGNNPDLSLDSAFEAISVQTFTLKNCEFDFFSEAPGYLDSLSVKDINEATHKFKIKIGKIEKSGIYSFDNYIISEYAKDSFTGDIVSQELGRNAPSPSNPYFEETDYKYLNSSDTFYTNYRESIFPQNKLIDEYRKAQDASDALRQSPISRFINSELKNAANLLNVDLNSQIGKATGGLIGTNPLGNVYGKPSNADVIVNALNDFLNPGSQFTTPSATKSTSQTLGNIYSSSFKH